MAGIVRVDEQSNVPFVATRMMVGISAFAIVCCGEYPPLAPISMICFPPTRLTLFSSAIASGVGRFEKVKAPPIRIPASKIDKTMAFISCIVLKIKEGWYKADHDETIN